MGLRTLNLGLVAGITLTFMGCSSSSLPGNGGGDASSNGTPDSGGFVDSGNLDSGSGGTKDATSGDTGGTLDSGGGDSGTLDGGGGDSGPQIVKRPVYPSNLLAQVESAAPAYFGGTATGTMHAAILRHDTPFGMGGDEDAGIDVPQFEQTFFGNGPVDLYFILPNIDNVIAGLNNPSDTSACLTQAPVPYTLYPFNLDAGVQMYAQCYTAEDGGYLTEWGVTDAGTFYLWDHASDVEWTAVVATPVDAGTTPDDAGGDATVTQAYAVHAWLGVGENGVWDASPGPGSTGVIEVLSDPAGSSFEMSVAGMGFQYCGAQVVSDGVNIFVEGSLDLGVNGACGSTASACVDGDDGGIVTGACTVDGGFFTLPSYGRLATTAPPAGVYTSDAGWDGAWVPVGPSLYPDDGGGDNIEINGNGTGSIFFGPEAPAAGVGEHP